MTRSIFGDFILILSSFAEGLTVTRTAERASVAETTVRRIFHTIRQQMAEDIQTSPKIGGPSTIVEIDEAKFGKQKFNRGRPVQGTWLAGGVQRHSDGQEVLSTDLLPALLDAQEALSADHFQPAHLAGVTPPSPPTAGRPFRIPASHSTDK